MDDLARFCCQNAACSLYGRRNAGNLSVCDRYGKHQQIRLLYCKACKARFSERKGTPLSHSCLPPEKAVSVFQHLVDGNGIRQTERLVGRPSRHRHAAGTPGRGACRGRPRRTRGLFPPRPARSNSTRSGRSSPRSRRTATPPTRPMTTRGTGGTTWPTTPSTAWSWPSSPAPARSRTPRRAVREAHDRTAGATDVLLTSDAYPAYETAIDHVYGVPEPPRPPGTTRPPPGGTEAPSPAGPEVRDGPRRSGRRAGWWRS